MGLIVGFLLGILVGASIMTAVALILADRDAKGRQDDNVERDRDGEVIR